MGHRVLELSLVSASNLKDVNLFTDMEVYAVASIYGDPRTRQRTQTDREGGKHPTWDDMFLFVVPPTADEASAEDAYLHVLLRTERFFGNDRDIGEVFVPLADLLAGACDGATPWQCESYQVQKVKRTKCCGMLSVSYRLGPVVGPLLPDTDCWDDPYKLPPWECYPVPYAYKAEGGAALSSAESYAAGAKA